MKTALSEPILRGPTLRHNKPVVYTPEELVREYLGSGPKVQACAPGYDHYVMARPMNGFGSWLSRAKLAIAVFRGQADVLQWEQGQ